MKAVLVFVLTWIACAYARETRDVILNALVEKARQELGDLSVVSRTEKRALTQFQQNDFVNAHNQARGRARPKPSDEPNVSWDNDLAELAQSYADKCIWGHNKARSDGTAGKKFGYVGENLFITTYTDVHPSAAVEAWEGEIQYYDYYKNACQTGKMCGHYTQVVWHDSTKVGCGIKVCPTVQNSSFKQATIMVCNYGPGGNYRGQKPYPT